jgi:dTMP kinase
MGRSLLYIARSTNFLYNLYLFFRRKKRDLGIGNFATELCCEMTFAQYFATVVLPALYADETLVISDRCLDSSIAYQGVAQGVGTDLVEELLLLATQGHVPDLTIFLDLEPAQVGTRTDSAQDQSGLREPPSRFDRESEQFHRRLREAFLALAAAHPERIKVIDAAQSIQCVHEQIVALVEKLLQSGDRD